MRLSVIALLAPALCACAHPAAPSGAAGTGAGPVGTLPADDAAGYFPLAVGNQWTWLDRSPSTPSGTPARRTVRILSRDAEGYFLDSDKGALKASGPCIQDRLRRILCAPFRAGRTWTSIVSVTSTEHYEIAGVAETVRVPAGSFEGCVRVRARNRAGPATESQLEISYAPGVGPVRIETFAVSQGKASLQVRAELESYHLEGQ